MLRLAIVISSLLLFAANTAQAHTRRFGRQQTQSWRNNVTPPDVTAPTDGSPLALTSAPDGTIALSWPAATDAIGVDHYEVRIATGLTPPADCNSGSTNGGCNDPSGTNCTLTGLTFHQIYSVRVCAVDVAANMSAGITGDEQSWQELLMVTFDGVNENAVIADNAALECGAAMTEVTAVRVTTCSSGLTCDDYITGKVNVGFVSKDKLVEYAALGWNVRACIEGLANFYQVFMSGLGVWSFVVKHFNGAAVDGGDVGTDANAERLQVSGATCDGATPPVCPALSDRTGGTYNGTIATTITDRANPYVIGGADTTNGFNLAGDVMRTGVWCNVTTRQQVIECLFDPVTNKPLNWTQYSLGKRSSGGLNCATDILNDPATFLPLDGDTFGTFTQASGSTAGNATQNNMESGDTSAHAFY